MQAALTRFRVMAYVTGIALILLVFVGVPLKRLAGEPAVSTYVGLPHGLVFYPLYLLCVYDLYRRTRMSIGRVVLLVSAGIVPFLAFYVERKVTAGLAEPKATASTSA